MTVPETAIYSAMKGTQYWNYQKLNVFEVKLGVEKHIE
jgi:hypothetical protein